MDTSTPNDWGHAQAQPLLTAALAPLAGVMLSLLALWVAALPKLTHDVAVDFNVDCLGLTKQGPVTHAVVIDADNTVYWDGQALAGRAALDARMQVIGHIGWAEQAEVSVQPDKRANYGAVIAVLASAQRNGVRRMGVVAAPSSFMAGGCPAAL